MNHYICYIKSHCEAPDIEWECEARSKREACKVFSQRTGHGGYDVSTDDWYDTYISPKDIAQYVERG